MNYQKLYDTIVERAKNRELQGYKERHHVVPKCMNGSDDPSNIVELTAKEHFLCHKLLVNIYPDNRKLKFALWAMYSLHNNQQKREYKYGSKEYEQAKILMQEAHKNRKRSPESIEKQRRTMLGKPQLVSEQGRKNIARRNREKAKDPEFKLKIATTLGTNLVDQETGKFYPSIKNAAENFGRTQDWVRARIGKRFIKHKN